MNSFVHLLISFACRISFDFLFFMFFKLDVCVINLRGTNLRETILPLSLPVRDHRNTIRKYYSNHKYYSNNNSRMDEKINRTRGSAEQVDQRKKLSAVKYSLWTTRSAIRLLELIVSEHVFLPSIGHVGQSKTSDPA